MSSLNPNTCLIETLESTIQRHNRRYFVEHAPEISDAEFDVLIAALRRRAPASAVLREIGSDVSGARGRVAHAMPMLSLDKCYTAQELAEWAEKFADAFVATPKIDGVAVSLRYDAHGELALAATRGSGREGEEITSNARQIANIPQTVALKNIEVRGEVYQPLSTFRKTFAAEFANPRNLAAGAVKLKDALLTASYGLQFFAYDLLGSDAPSEMDKRALLAQHGFTVAPGTLVTRDQFAATCAGMLAARAALDCETDGIVFKVNQLQEQARVGTTDHHPRYAIAFKFQGDSGETKLTAIEWNVARTGTITPVGIVEPVVLSGATVRRVTLHNFGRAQSLGVGVGATVRITRRGGVIPHLEEVIAPGDAVLAPPAECPSCGAPTRVEEDFVVCTNPRGCGKLHIAQFKHFLDAIDCEGFGPKVIENLIDAKLVQDPADLFALRIDDLLTLPRMGETLARKLIAHLHARRTLALDIFLRSLGIHELAHQTARVLAQCGSLEKIRSLTEAELAEMHGIGPQIARAVVHGLQSHRRLIDKLLQHVTIHDASPAQSSGPLAGKRFLFTGTLAAMERRRAQQLVEEAGGHLASSVSRELDFLVIGSEGKPGSKLSKARKLIEEGASVRILSEAEFLKII